MDNAVIRLIGGVVAVAHRQVQGTIPLDPNSGWMVWHFSAKTADPSLAKPGAKFSARRRSTETIIGYLFSTSVRSETVLGKSA
jgi:hypothetical protein